MPYERDVAMVFESPSYALYPNMTAFDNMAFGLRTRKDVPVPGAAVEVSPPPGEEQTQQPSKNEVREGADPGARRADRGAARSLTTTCSAGATSYRRGTARAWRWAAPWLASPGYS